MALSMRSVRAAPITDWLVRWRAGDGDALNVSAKTVQRAWTVARAWLRKDIEV